MALGLSLFGFNIRAVLFSVNAQVMKNGASVSVLMGGCFMCLMAVRLGKHGYHCVV